MAHVNEVSFADLKITYSIKTFRALHVFDTALAVLLCDVAWFGIHLFLPDRGECICLHGHFWAMQHQTNGCVTTLSSTSEDK
jgi:hypothetical protein